MRRAGPMTSIMPKIPLPAEINGWKLTPEGLALRSPIYVAGKTGVFIAARGDELVVIRTTGDVWSYRCDSQTLPLGPFRSLHVASLALFQWLKTHPARELLELEALAL